MICVSIGRGRHRHVIAEHRHLVSQGAKLVELRLDYINGKINLKRLMTERPCPIVLTIRRDIDGGKWKGTEQERHMLLRAAIVDGVDYVDLEEDTAKAIGRYGKTKRIVSYHDFRQTPDDLAAIHARLAALDPDIIKITTMANSPHDNLRMMQLVQSVKVPTVGMCMGDLGTPSRILCGRFGAPFTYASFHHERLLAPGQLSFEEMNSVYHYDKIDAQTTVLGVIADPIGHSLSPLVHNTALRQAGINAVYVPFRVPAEHLDQFLTDAKQWGIRGLSVTIPHKEAVLKRLTKFDPAVKAIGAANTLVFEGDEIIGYNTDFRAALESVLRGVHSIHRLDVDEHLASVQSVAAEHQPTEDGLQGKTALLLGAGGAARAMVYGLKKNGAKVVVSSRTLKRAQQLAQTMGCDCIDWNNRHAISPDIVVNCTPVGMHPNVDETPYARGHLRSQVVVFDMVYNPENTLLIKEAKAQGCSVVTGIEMFVRQALLQFKLFTGQNASWELMRDTLKRAIGPAKA
ncbi:MAG TPA: type I 3-dehydroquinate dehydratase [Pirellulales bacterium]|nr:type I 3-dehydroquinate dehydratase [Pirellulales bacterium]